MTEKVDKLAQPIFPKEDLDHDNVRAEEVNTSDFRFMEGKWYVCIAEIVGFTIGKAYQAIEDDSLSPDDDGFFMYSPSYNSRYFRPWSFDDAKRGDVLYFKCGDLESVFIYDETIGIRILPLEIYNFKYKKLDEFRVGLDIGFKPFIQPATAEQRKIIFDALKKAGVELDIDNLSLRQNRNEQNSDPMFNIGDHIVSSDGSIRYVKGKNEKTYLVEDCDSGGVFVCRFAMIDEKYHAWTVNDARVGEVLISEWGQPFIYSGKCHDPLNGKVIDDALCAYCGIDDDGFRTKLDVYAGIWSAAKGVRPATVEERKAFYLTMAKNGYIWEPQKRETIEIKQ